MIFTGQPLAIATSLAPLIEKLAAEPRPKMSFTARAGSRVADVSLTGILEPAYSLSVRRQIARLTADAGVRAIRLLIDSPGGLVSGTPELAEIVRRAAVVKPIHVLAENYLASAAYHVAAQATDITVAPSTVVGSIGTIILLIDDSEAFRQLGLKSIVVITGEQKSVDMPGVSVTDSHVAMLQELVDADQSAFQVAIVRGRKLSVEQVLKVSTGAVWTAVTAKRLGLVDVIASADDRCADIEQMYREPHDDLTGPAAVNKLNELALTESRASNLENILPYQWERVRKNFPALAAAAKQTDDQTTYRRSLRRS